mgnify:CR=1 FL=1
MSDLLFGQIFETQHKFSARLLGLSKRLGLPLTVDGGGVGLSMTEPS